MASRLERLPTEIKEEILSWLYTEAGSSGEENKSSRRTYNSLCRTSKTLLDASFRWLHRSFNNLENNMHSDSEAKLAQNFCLQPHIASHLRRIELTPDHKQPGFEGGQMGLFARQLSSKIGDMRIFGEIIKALAHGCRTAQMLVLLSAATEVRHLDIRPAVGERDWFNCHCAEVFGWLAALVVDARSRGGYGQLQHLTVRDPGRYRPQHTGHEDILVLLRQLPALQEFHGKNYSGKEAWDAPEEETPIKQSSTLRVIELEGAGVGTRVLRELINSTKALTTLRVHWGTDWAWNDSDTNETFRPEEHIDDVYPPAILTSLRQHQSHLTSLILQNIQNRGLVFEDQTALGSLAAFESLTLLELDEYLLRGKKDTPWQEVDLTGKLPPNLQDFTVHTYGSVEVLGDICHALSDFTGGNSCITFEELALGHRNAPDDPLNTRDIAFFGFPPREKDQRLCFWVDVEQAEGTLRQIGDLLKEHGEDLIGWLFEGLSPFSVDKEGRVRVWGYKPQKLVPNWLIGKEEEDGDEEAFDPRDWLELGTD